MLILICNLMCNRGIFEHAVSNWSEENIYAVVLRTYLIIAYIYHVLAFRIKNKNYKLNFLSIMSASP